MGQGPVVAMRPTKKQLEAARHKVHRTRLTFNDPLEQRIETIIRCGLLVAKRVLTNAGCTCIQNVGSDRHSSYSKCGAIAEYSSICGDPICSFHAASWYAVDPDVMDDKIEEGNWENYRHVYCVRGTDGNYLSAQTVEPNEDYEAIKQAHELLVALQELSGEVIACRDSTCERRADKDRFAFGGFCKRCWKDANDCWEE